MAETYDWSDLAEALARQEEMVRSVTKLRIRTSVLLWLSAVLVAAVAAIAALGWKLYDLTQDIEELAKNNEVNTCQLRNTALLSVDLRWDALFDSLEELFPESLDVIDRLRSDSEAASEPPRDCTNDGLIDQEDYST